MIDRNKLTTRKLTIIGLLGAVSAVLGLTPIGLIPVGATNATIMHIPVIIGAILEGPLVGALVGLIFGVFSIIRAITAPTIISPFLYNPLVSVLPRVLIGITSYYSYILFKRAGRKLSITILIITWFSAIIYLTKILINQFNIYSIILILITIWVGIYSYRKFKEQAVEVVISSMIGTLTNTVGVLGMMYLLYAAKFVEAMGKNTETAGKLILGIAITNGIPEMIIATLIVTSVVVGLKMK